MSDNSDAHPQIHYQSMADNVLPIFLVGIYLQLTKMLVHAGYLCFLCSNGERISCRDMKTMYYMYANGVGIQNS